MTTEAKAMASNESAEGLAQRLLEWERRARDAEDKVEALSAHVERLRGALEYSHGYLNAGQLNSIGHGSKAHWEMQNALGSSPATSLDRLKDDIRAEVWNEINGPVSASGEPVIPAPPPLDDRALRLCYAIEEAGASETLTEASVLASQLLGVLRRHCTTEEPQP